MIDPAEQRPVGATGARISRLGIGGGSSFGRATVAPEDLVDACWDAGLRYFDTAPLYGGGESERRFGRALARYPRDHFTVSTKVGRDGERAFDYSANGVRQSILASLDRLGLAHVDMVMIHDVDPDMHGDAFEARFEQAMKGAYPVLDGLRSQGAIKAIGVGVKYWNVCLRFAHAGRFDCFMLAGGYTLLQQDSLSSFLPYCLDHGIAVIVAAPFNSGILATGAVEGARYNYGIAPAPILAQVRALEAACDRHAVPLAAAALQFPLLHPAVAAIVAGHESPAEVARNVALLRHPIPEGLWKDLAAGGLLRPGAVTG